MKSLSTVVLGGSELLQKLKNWYAGRVRKSERGRGPERAGVCKCLLKLNSDVCAAVLKYSKSCIVTHKIHHDRLSLQKSAGFPQTHPAAYFCILHLLRSISALLPAHTVKQSPFTPRMSSRQRSLGPTVSADSGWTGPLTHNGLQLERGAPTTGTPPGYRVI